MTRTTIAFGQPPLQWAADSPLGVHIEPAIASLADMHPTKVEKLVVHPSRTASRFLPISSTGALIKSSSPQTSPACRPSHV